MLDIELYFEPPASVGGFFLSENPGSNAPNGPKKAQTPENAGRIDYKDCEKVVGRRFCSAVTPRQGLGVSMLEATLKKLFGDLGTDRKLPVSSFQRR